MDSTNIIKEEELYNQLQTNDRLYNHMFSFIKPMALKCALQLGLFDAVHNNGKPMRLDKMGPVLSIHPEKTTFLPHILRILTHMGYLSEHTLVDMIKTYDLTALSKSLLRNRPFSARPIVLMMLELCLMNPYHHLSSWLQGDERDPFSMANGMPLWEYAGHDPELNHNFNQAMANDSKVVGKFLIAKSEERKGLFEGVSSLVDVAGGTGEMAKAVAEAYPHIKCIVLDLRHVVAGSQGKDNLTYVAGDIFVAVPPADVVLLKWIMHDWDDKDSLRLLKQCKKAITRNKEGPGKLIIIDAVFDDEHDKDSELRETQLLFDMEVVTILKGKERAMSEWKKLIEDAGFKGGYKIHSMMGVRSIIEVYP